MTIKIASYLTMPSSTISRDHPFNQSQRPLLADRKPQFLLKKNGQKFNVSNSSSSDENSKLHGFNDFDDVMSKQYRNLNTHNIGYPYGSPPSPTIINSKDFRFSDDSNDIKITIKPYPPSAVDEDNYYSNVDEYYNNCNSKTGIGSLGNNNNNNNKNIQQLLTNKKLNYDWKMNKNQFQSSTDNNSTSGGPFIFGIHSETTSYNNVAGTNRIIESSSLSSESKSAAVINPKIINIKKMKMIKNKSQSISDTSSSSREYEKQSKLLVKCRKKSAKRNNKDKLKFGKQPNIKCVVVGDGAVGKTSLIVSYLESRFTPEHIPTASDIYNAEVMVNDSPVNITLCDTAGQDTLDQLRELCYPDSDVFLLCFSVVKPETFNSIKTKWAPKFSKSKASLILVGTQADLRNDIHILNKLQTQGEKTISFADAWDLATSIGAKYIETSSFTQEKVKDTFDAAIWEALLPTHLPSQPPLWKRLLCLV